MKRISLVVGTAVLSSLAVAAIAAGTPKYRITELPGVNPGSGFVFVADMNESGVVVGGSTKTDSGTFDDTRIRPIVWTDGVRAELPVFSTDGLNSAARGINDHGVVVGESGIPDGGPFTSHAAKWTQGVPTDLGTLPGDDRSRAFRVNKTGTAVGTSGPEFDFFGGSTAVRWDGTTITSLGRLFEDDLDSNATGINKHGVIVGTSGDDFGNIDGLERAVYWDAAGIHQLPFRPGDNFATANGINDHGVIVGAAGTLEGEPFFASFLVFTDPVRWVDGEIETLPILPGDTGGRAFAINKDGLIVGESVLADEFGFPIESHPVMWVDGQVVDLNSIDRDASGWVFTFVTAVNDKGQIAGTGFHDGVEMAFLATPGKGKSGK